VSYSALTAEIKYKESKLIVLFLTSIHVNDNGCYSTVMSVSS
jgi:hypothetical protein